jgi:hypothetical protein
MLASVGEVERRHGEDLMTTAYGPARGGILVGY